MHQLVLLRHGESQWNRENRFTGWADVDLTEAGLAEARRAGALLKAEGFDFDIAYTSVLRRAIRSLWAVLEEMDRMWLPTVHTWRLNERHYGNLQGLNKAETAARYGEEQVLIWRRAYAIAPEPLADGDPRLVQNDPRYAHVPASQIPRTECLQDTVARVVPFWNDSIAPALMRGRRIIIAAHEWGNVGSKCSSSSSSSSCCASSGSCTRAKSAVSKHRSRGGALAARGGCGDCLRGCGNGHG